VFKQILLNERLRVARLLLGAATCVWPDLALTFRSVPESVEMIDPRMNSSTRSRESELSKSDFKR
jgi:hypothetical protein